MPQTILIVDDERDVVDLLDFNLRAEGYNVEAAFTGPEALEKARAVLPDLIVLDLMLPELDGTAVCEILRRLPTTATIPILMLTACVSEAARQIAAEAGADKYMSKPFSPRELIKGVKSLIGRESPENAIQSVEGAV